MRDQLIRAHDQNSVFVERANRQPRSPQEVEEVWRVRPGRGKAFVEFDAEDAEVRQQYNNLIKGYELYLIGDVALAGRNAQGRRNR